MTVMGDSDGELLGKDVVICFGFVVGSRDGRSVGLIDGRRVGVDVGGFVGDKVGG